MLEEGRIPKQCDIVGAQGHSGPLIVVSVDEKARTVNVRAHDGKGPLGPVERGIPWSTLTFLESG
jgi:hypothetical protein